MRHNYFTQQVIWKKRKLRQKVEAALSVKGWSGIKRNETSSSSQMHPSHSWHIRLATIVLHLSGARWQEVEIRMPTLCKCTLSVSKVWLSAAAEPVEREGKTKLSHHSGNIRLSIPANGEQSLVALKQSPKGASARSHCCFSLTGGETLIGTKDRAAAAGGRKELKTISVLMSA